MKSNIHGSGLLRRLPALIVALSTIIMTEQAHSHIPIMPAPQPPGFYIGGSIGYDINRFSSFDLDYGGLLTLDDAATESNNSIYAGLTVDYCLGDPRDWIWSVSSAILVRRRSFSTRADGVAIPLDANSCAGAVSAAGTYDVEFDNLEVNLSAIVNRRLWQSRFHVGLGLGLGITGQSREEEHLTVEPDALFAGPECRIVQTDRIVPREEGNVADVYPETSEETVLDPQMILSLRYVLGSVGRIVVTPTATLNIGMSGLGGEEAQWRRTSLSFGLELTKALQ